MCDCDVLEVKSNGTIGNQNFTRQRHTLFGKPFYFSMKKDVIYWNKTYWSFSVHIDEGFQKYFHEEQKYEMNFFSPRNICKNTTWSGIANTTYFLKTRCLRDNNNCSETRQVAINEAIEDYKRVELKAKQCSAEETMLKADEVAVKSWYIELVVGILVAVILIITFFVGYIYIRKKKGVTSENATVANEYTEETFMEGNQARINSNIVLNEQAAHLSYSR